MTGAIIDEDVDNGFSHDDLIVRKVVIIEPLLRDSVLLPTSASPQNNYIVVCLYHLECFKSTRQGLGERAFECTFFSTDCAVDVDGNYFVFEFS